MNEATPTDQAQAAPKPQDAAVVNSEAVKVAEQATTQPEAQTTEISQEAAAKEEAEQHKSRSARRRERLRDRAVAAETESRMLREQMAKQTQQAPQREVQADDSPKREQFNTYEEYIRADAKWNAQQEARTTVRQELEDSRKEESQRSQKEAQAKVAKEWEGSVDAARDAIDDFDDVCGDSEAPVTDAMRAAILESGDKGPFIAYHLAKNPAEAERIAKLSPTRQAAEIVKLEEKVTKPAKTPSKAPPPISPLGTKGDADGNLDTTNPKAAEKLSTAEWIRRDRERLSKAAGTH